MQHIVHREPEQYNQREQLPELHDGLEIKYINPTPVYPFTICDSVTSVVR